MKEALDKVKELFAPLETMIDEAESIVKDKMLGYNRILQAEEDKRRLVLEEEAKKKNTDEGKVEKAVEKVEAIIEKREAIPTRKNRVVKIVDESKIPDRYWVIDMVLLRKDMLENGLEVAGAVIEIEESIINKF